MNKVLITGATGFIGTHLTNELLDRNYQVRALVRTQQGFLPDNVETATGDLTVPGSIESVCDNIETVFHLAGLAHAWKENDANFNEKHDAVNFHGTQVLFREAVRAGVKHFIYFSSVKAVADSRQLIDEQWQTAPETPYGIAKRKAELFLLEEAPKNNIHLVILRPALVYGPGCKGNLNAMLKAIDKNYFIPVPAIKNRRSMISLGDICQAAILSASHPAANGKIYFVTDGMDYSTRQLYVLIRQAMGKTIPKWSLPLSGFKLLGLLGDVGQKILRRRLPFNSESMVKLFDSAAYNSQLIRHELGFQPKDTLNKCLPEIIATYRLQEAT